MGCSISHPAEASDRAHVVRRPRATDAVGQALRGAYARAPALPDDMLAALERIDRAACLHH